MLEGIPYPAMILDDAFQIVTVNELMEVMTGYKTDQITGVYGELVVRSSTGNNRQQQYSKVFETGEPLSVTGDILNGQRRKVPIQYHISKLTGETGNHGLLVIAEDISARMAEKGFPGRDYTPEDLVGYSPKMQEVFDLVPLMANTDASVLITGETGTGKDKIAEIIHQESSRSRFPFIKVNCGALPGELLESELFGHVKGAFTGASRSKQGMFKLADKGTLFLTEIGDMPLPLQVKLLSVLDDRRFMPVGGEKEVEVDVRIIAATHRPLREQVRKNLFRQDLFYRLNVLHVHLPPLRERETDVRYLLDHFLEKFATALGKGVVGFNSEAMDFLLEYPYPGNIRELRNIAEYSVNVCKKKEITRSDLPSYIFELEEIEPEVQQKVEVVPNGMVVEKKQEPAAAGGLTSWGSMEREKIVATLTENDGSRTKTAESLGWSRMKLWRKMKKYELL